MYQMGLQALIDWLIFKILSYRSFNARDQIFCMLHNQELLSVMHNSFYIFYVVSKYEQVVT